ncbi:MAG: PorV/PorQ family protein [candidate division Zixibacteria bacterium]|nr:PorV/PorQ family protein [candidate division Zixibacteria bacterium]
MKRVYAIVILTLVVSLMAGSTAWAVSNAAALYLRVAAGARPAGMGEAFVSIADDATATYWNPAGLGNSPIAGMLKTTLISDQKGRGFAAASAPEEIMSAVTMEGSSGRTETWVIAGDRLLKFDGENWQSGIEYRTSSDQTLVDFLKTIINVKDENELAAMSAAVVAINCPVGGAEVDSFVATVTASIPEGYGAKDDLLAGLEKIKTGYLQGLLIADQFRVLQDKLKNGLKDGTLTAEETDRLTYSLDRSLSRYLPGELMVPYSIGINARMTCLGAAGPYLWVGTENGLYRLAGQVWAQYLVEHGLPSNNILTMAGFDETLLIGTDQGLIQYYQGAFTGVPGIPAAPVTVITMKSREAAYAIAGGIVYRFDGLAWSDSYEYTVRIDDSLDKLVARCMIYGTAEERDYLRRRILDLNRPMAMSPLTVQTTDSTGVPVVDTAVVAVDTTAQEQPEVMMPPAAAAESTAVGQAATPVAGDDTGRWLVEGNVIRLPISPMFRFVVTAMDVDLVNTLWVGTTNGLVSFDGFEWARYGYTKYVVPAGDSAAPGQAMTADEIAATFLKGADSSRVALLAKNIDLYNQLNGAPVPPGGEVYVYSSNLGSTIQSVGLVFGVLHVGTEYGLEKRTKDGWEMVNLAEMDRQQVVAARDYQGQSVFVTRNGMTTETKGAREIVLMHVKWLPSLDQDMYYEYLSYVQHLRGIGSIGLSVVFLSYGTIQYTDEGGAVIGEGHPLELAVALSYGSSLTSQLKWGLTGKFVHSRLSDIGAGQERGEGIASAFALDMGILYKITDRLQFGAAITNIGPNITYIDKAQSDPLPRNLGIGFSYKILNSTYNKLIVQTELNKILVNMDHGIGTELEYAIRHIGAEYVYANLIALRAGYKYDKEGQVKHLTFGAGLQLAGGRLDFAYIPSSTDSPLANTLRVSAGLRF